MWVRLLVRWAKLLSGEGTTPYRRLSVNAARGVSRDQVLCLSLAVAVMATMHTESNIDFEVNVGRLAGRIGYEDDETVVSHTKGVH